MKAIRPSESKATLTRLEERIERKMSGEYFSLSPLKQHPIANNRMATKSTPSLVKRGQTPFPKQLKLWKTRTQVTRNRNIEKIFNEYFYFKSEYKGIW